MSSSASSNADRTPRVVRGVEKELGGFKKFLLRGNVVDLAVGVVIGAAFGNVVQSVVDNFINPLIGIFGGGQSLNDWAIPVAGATIRIGAILNALISFVLIAAVVYFLVVLPVNKLMDRYRPEPKPSPTKECSECLSAIPQDARRCRECGAQLSPPSEAVAAAMRQVAAPSGAAIADQAAQVLRERLAGER
jgi:large conductance mechanosensitive channel